MAGEDPDQLSSDDAHILAVESASIAGHGLKLIILEPGASAMDLDGLRGEVQQRLPSQPRATQRVDPSGAHPRWVTDPDFDIRNHVRRAEAPGCVSTADLWQVVSALMSEHLDRRRPLWTMDLIGPLADGREAIAVRMHHAMVDGIAGVRFCEALLWDVLADSDISPPTAGIHSGTTEPKRRLTEARRMPAALFRELGHPGSRSPFDRAICISRELAFTTAPLADIKAIGKSRPRPATVNDVLLAIVAGGLRTWLSHGETPTPRLRAQIPVSLHHRDEHPDELGNRDSFLNIDLPLAEPDPLVRLDFINTETSTRKRLGDAQELYDLFHALGRIKHLDSAVARLAGSAREFSLSISNVPGPPAPISVAGRPVEHMFSSSEPAAHHALRIAAISYAANIGIGLCTDPDALPGVTTLAAAIDESYDELRRAAIG